MRRIVFSVFLLGLFHAGLFAEVEKIPLTWTVGQGVRVVGATPIGQLYQFDPSPSCTYLTYSKHRLRAGCRCISCQTLLQAVSGNLEVSLPKNRKKRFGALLFQLRVCPAFSKNETAEAVFFLMGSSLERISGKSYGNLSNMLEVTPRQVKYSALGSRTNRTAVEIPYPSDPQSVFLPDFEIFPVLFAYDFQTGRIAMRHYGDDRIRFSRESDIPIDRKNLKNLAFSMGPSRKTFRSHIELSDPTFYAFDREEELDSIPIPKLTEYSYRDYPFPEQKKKKSKKSNLLKSIQKSGNPFNVLHIHGAYLLLLIPGNIKLALGIHPVQTVKAVLVQINEQGCHLCVIILQPQLLIVAAPHLIIVFLSTGHLVHGIQEHQNRIQMIPDLCIGMDQFSVNII